MQGLVEHPFQEGLDGVLRQIDPTIPLPTESVETVVEKCFRAESQNFGLLWLLIKTAIPTKS